MQKAIITSSLIARRVWYSKQDPLSFVKQAVENHPTWGVENTKTEQVNDTTIISEIVLKNTTGVLNYDPRVIFKIYDNKIFMGVAKSYDNNLMWYDQEGALNNGGNYVRFGLVSIIWMDNIGASQIYSISVNDYSFIITQKDRRGGDYWGSYNNNSYIKFEIFNTTNKDNSGMYVEYADSFNNYFYIYSDSIWYGKDWNNIYTRLGKLDIDKPVGTYHKPNKKGAFNAINKSFFINTVDDEALQPLWQYIGKSYLSYAYTGIYQQRSYDGDYWHPHNFLYVDKELGHYTTAYTTQGRKSYYITGIDHQVIDASVLENPTYVEQIL